jgi:hypothetical protein
MAKQIAVKNKDDHIDPRERILRHAKVLFFILLREGLKLRFPTALIFIPRPLAVLNFTTFPVTPSLITHHLSRLFSFRSFSYGA